MLVNKSKTKKEFCLRGHPRTPENLRLRSCKICSALMTKAAARRRRKRNPILFLFNQLKGNARKRGQEFTITLVDILPAPTHCPILGLELDYSGTLKRCSDNLPSVDRLDSHRGYVPGNVAIISHRANVLKNSASLEEMKKLVAWTEARLTNAPK